MPVITTSSWTSVRLSFSNPDQRGAKWSKATLKWCNIIYRCNTTTTLTFPDGRSLRIYGSLLTEQWGVGTFQYPAGRDVWAHRVPHDTDVLLTHCPPKGHLHRDGLASSRFLLGEIRRVKPQLVVFCHVHGGYGQEKIMFDAIQATYDRVLPAGKDLF